MDWKARQAHRTVRHMCCTLHTACCHVAQAVNAGSVAVKESLVGTTGHQIARRVRAVVVLGHFTTVSCRRCKRGEGAKDEKHKRHGTQVARV